MGLRKRGKMHEEEWERERERGRESGGKRKGGGR